MSYGIAGFQMTYKKNGKHPLLKSRGTQCGKLSNTRSNKRKEKGSELLEGEAKLKWFDETTPSFVVEERSEELSEKEIVKKRREDVGRSRVLQEGPRLKSSHRRMQIVSGTGVSHFIPDLCHPVLDSCNVYRHVKDSDKYSTKYTCWICLSFQAPVTTGLLSSQ